MHTVYALSFRYSPSPSLLLFLSSVRSFHSFTLSIRIFSIISTSFSFIFRSNLILHPIRWCWMMKFWKTSLNYLFHFVPTILHTCPSNSHQLLVPIFCHNYSPSLFSFRCWCFEIENCRLLDHSCWIDSFVWVGWSRNIVVIWTVNFVSPFVLQLQRVNSDLLFSLLDYTC